MGDRLRVREAWASEAIVFAVRGAVLIVPSPVGIQEGGLSLAAHRFGSADTALALYLQ